MIAPRPKSAAASIEVALSPHPPPMSPRGLTAGPTRIAACRSRKGVEGGAAETGVFFLLGEANGSRDQACPGPDPGSRDDICGEANPGPARIAITPSPSCPGLAGASTEACRSARERRPWIPRMKRGMTIKRERKQTTPAPKAPRRRVRPEVWVVSPPGKGGARSAASDDPS